MFRKKIEIFYNLYIIYIYILYYTYIYNIYHNTCFDKIELYNQILTITIMNYVI